MTFHRVESLVRVISLPCQGQEVVRRAGGSVHLNIGIINIINIRNIIIYNIFILVIIMIITRLSYTIRILRRALSDNFLFIFP